jgi:LDH2 family malate/lactate/ureidoglycolate dehydrogenase
MKVQPNRLKEVAIHILKGLNATDEEAALVAEILVQADMRGTDTHGVHLLTLLPDRVAAGMIQIPTNLKVIKEGETTTLLDGANGLGQFAVHRAMETNIQKAKKFGLGCTLVRNTNNIGSLIYYTLMAAQEGMVGRYRSLFRDESDLVRCSGGDRRPCGLGYVLQFCRPGKDSTC